MAFRTSRVTGVFSVLLFIWLSFRLPGYKPGRQLDA
jgi:hypothetical protein